MSDAEELERLRERVRELEAADRQKDQLLGMLAHDLRNPLSAIRSASEVLMLTLGSEPRVQRAHAILDRQTTVMMRVIDRLCVVTEMLRGTLMLQRKKVDLTRISQLALDENSERVASADLKVESNLPSHAIWIDGDTVRLAEIFESLFSNAIKYGRPSGMIQLTVEKNGSNAIVRFKRDGDRLEPSLGLVLAKGLIELHGGTMIASCNTGQSTMFELRVPLAQ